MSNINLLNTSPFEKPYLCQYVNLSNIDFMLSYNTPQRFYPKLHNTPNPFDFLGACTVIGLEVLTMNDYVMLETFVLSFSELFALHQSE